MTAGAATGVQEAKIESKPRVPSGRMRSLDGLRAISIALVLLGHLGGTRGLKAVNLQIGDYAHLGVVVFFVISGFLITTLLMVERAVTGEVSLKLFYARRSIRIFPAACVYLAVLAILGVAGVVHLKPGDMWHAITYTENFHGLHAWQVGHLWSLSVEEQFYLLWPFAFVALGVRRSIWAPVCVVFLAIAARLFARFFLYGTPYENPEMFPMVADSLAMGCLLAMLRSRLESMRWYLRLFQPGWSLLLLVVALALNRYEDYTVVTVFGTAIINVCLAVLIHRSVYHADDAVGAFLNWKPLMFVGVLSYSLYLWQQLFANRTSSAWVNAFPQNLIFAVCAGVVSYYVIEKPLLGLRHRLRVKAGDESLERPAR
jgi:peptidoglycan/LPS O-acetylase OafA/YrhL